MVDLVAGGSVEILIHLVTFVHEFCLLINGELIF